MPELPEVETVVRTLEKQISQEEILDVTVRYAPIVHNRPEAFRKALVHEHFRSFERRGKYLMFRMDHVILCVHLRMEGKFYLLDHDAPADRHTHVIFRLKDRDLRYHDTRKFGRMSILPYDADLSRFHDLGPEPLSDAYSSSYIYACSRKRSVPLKTLLLDQHFAAGIGNIYADEILFACRLRPGRNCRRITHRDAENIEKETKRILHAAILAGGTTIRSYTSSLGVTGRFQLDCAVHTKKICPVCGGAIRIRTIGGRSSYYCPHCQK